MQTHTSKLVGNGDGAGGEASGSENRHVDRVWRQFYPEGVPAEINPSQYQSLVHLLEEAFQKHAARKAFVCMGKYLTFTELDQLSKKIGAWLQSKGLEKGARVVIMLPNLLHYPVVIAAILRAGYVVVNVNPLYTPRELEHQLNDSGAEVIFILENFATTLQKIVATTKIKHIVVATMGDLMGIKGVVVNMVVRHIKKLVPAFSLPNAVPFHRVLSDAASLLLHPVELTQNDIAFLQYTGGTTGVSKGAMLSHRNVVANILQAEVWLMPGMKKGKAVDQLTFVCALPLYHIFALTVSCLLGMREGVLNLLIPNPRDIGGLIKELSKYPVNMFPAVNTLYNAVLNHPHFAKLDFSSYRICVAGGMALQKTVADKWQKIVGCPIIEGYGLSETSPIASANPTTITEATGTIGLPMPSTDIAILDDDGHPVAFGQSGEIAIRGPQVMLGYWQRPNETAMVMTADGFFKSGDIGLMDHRGYTKIVDRKKDMILVSGFNVYPNEIEEIVAAHPAVLECACIGVPDEHAGEVVKIFVVRKDLNLTAEQLMMYCREQLTGYKRPKYIEFREELPKTNIGKILRRELRVKSDG